MSDQENQVRLPKRRRTAIACLSCRTRKSRCDGAWPSCSMCRDLGETCRYVGPNRKHQPTVSAPTHDEWLSSIDSKLDRLLAAAAAARPPSSLAGGLNDVSSIRNDEVKVLACDDALDSASDDTAFLADCSGCVNAYFGPTSSIAFLKALCTASCTVLNTTIVQPAHPTDRMKCTSEVEQALKNPHRKNPLALPARDEVYLLLRHYFENISSLFPFIHLESMYASYERGRSQGFRPSFLALLNIIFAFTIFEDRRGSADASSSKRNLFVKAETFFARADALLADMDMFAYDVETVQCLLLMVNYSQSTLNSARVLSLFSRAVTAAMQLGLHCPTLDASLSVIEKEIRIRTWWACICLDRVLSMTFGRPPSIPDSYVLVDLPISQSLEELSRPSRSVSCNPSDGSFFVSTIQLYQILSKIISDLYNSNVTAPRQVTILDITDKIHAIEHELRTWYQALPSYLQCRPPLAPSTPKDESADPKLSFLAFTLYVRYLNIRILNYRSSLRFQFLGLSNGSVFQSQHNRDLGSNIDTQFVQLSTRQTLATMEECASELIDVLQTYGEQHSAVGLRSLAMYYIFHACMSLYGVFVVLAGNHLHRGSSPHWLRDDLDGMQRIVGTLRKGKDALKDFSRDTSPVTRSQQQTLLAQMVDIASAWTSQQQQQQQQQQQSHISSQTPTFPANAPEHDETHGFASTEPLALGDELDPFTFSVASLEEFLHGTMDTFCAMDQTGSLF